MKHLDLFSGIGGFALACQWAGIETIGFVEIDKYCQKVLRKHWPAVPIVEDIRDVDRIKELAIGNSAILATGGFPCQPFSTSGRRLGAADNRYLWPQMLHVIKEVRPHWVLGENVAGIVRMELDTVLSDLERIGYSTQAFIIPACGVGARHRRDRVWVVAVLDNSQRTGHLEQPGRTTALKNSNREENRLPKPTGQDVTDTKGTGLEGSVTKRHPCAGGQSLQSSQAMANSTQQHIGGAEIFGWRGARQAEVEGTGGGNGRPWDGLWAVEPELGRVAHGIPNRVDRLKCLGNAIVPQVAYEIIKAIVEIDKLIPQKDYTVDRRLNNEATL